MNLTSVRQNIKKQITVKYKLKIANSLISMQSRLLINKEYFEAMT
jgi:hypothetical protein